MWRTRSDLRGDLAGSATEVPRFSDSWEEELLGMHSIIEHDISLKPIKGKASCFMWCFDEMARYLNICTANTFTHTHTHTHTHNTQYTHTGARTHTIHNTHTQAHTRTHTHTLTHTHTHTITATSALPEPLWLRILILHGNYLSYLIWWRSFTPMLETMETDLLAHGNQLHMALFNLCKA